MFSGSYLPKDVLFLLKDVSGRIKEMGTQEREREIQMGRHYSEMLPVEYKPTKEYIDLFYYSLEKYAKKIAISVGVVSENIVQQRGKSVVLVSLARAGVPIGVLINRYIRYKYELDTKHYAISIIRGKGIDENALKYILSKHSDAHIQFIDGWTGKGAIKKVLDDAVLKYNKENNVNISNSLAVLSDPGCCANIYGTREDFLIPSSCLNSTVSGLISRTILRDDLIGKDDFHGVKYYENLKKQDVSNYFIDTICKEFETVISEIEESVKSSCNVDEDIKFEGLRDVLKIQQEYNICDYNLIKPGIGETTRVLLRRLPWKILIKSYESVNLEHILLLTKEKSIPVELYEDMKYECCGIIQNLKGEI